MTVRLIGAPFIVRRQRIRQRLLVLFQQPFVPGAFSSLVRLAQGPSYSPAPSLRHDRSLIHQIRFLIQNGTLVTPVIVPNVVGLQESGAIFAITSVALVPQEIYQITPGGVADQVILQSPVALTSVNIGSAVTITIVAYLVTANVVGLQQAAAITALAGFNITITSTANAAPAGTVLTQSVPPGTKVTQGFSNPATQPAITISVSTGPGFSGFTLGQALAILSNAGFVVNPVFIYHYSNTVPWNYVIGQLPAAGTQQKYQSVGVQLTVSMGPKNPVLTAVVPNITNMQLVTAVSDLMAAKINIGSVTWVQGPQSICSVLAQSIAGGTIVAPYTNINLTVCSGPVVIEIINTIQTVPLVH